VPPEAPAVPPAPPIETPPHLNADAWFAFKKMVRTCGKTVFRMPSSCEMYLRQHLARFPAERDLLLASLRQDVPNCVMEHDGRDGYDEFLTATIQSFCASGEYDPAEAKWAVEAWATALGRPPGYQAPPPVARAIAPPPQAISEAAVGWIMKLIVAAGGFLGGLLGNGAAILFFLVAGVAVDSHYSHDATVGQTQVAIAILMIVSMLMGGVLCGLGALAGWSMGKGDERPWSGFAAACGAAFSTGCFLFFVRGPGLSAAIGMAVATWGATFATASRGGRRI
jgi:hypothetical protein